MADSKNSFSNDFLSVIGGVLAALLAIAIIFPILLSFAYQFMGLHDHEKLTGKSSQNDLAIEIIFYSTIAIPALIGGLTSTLLSARKKIGFGLLTAIILLLIIYFTSTYYLVDSFWLAYLKLIIIILGASYLGCFIGIKIKGKGDTIDNSSRDEIP